MAEAGADVVVCHMGLTTGGSIGAKTGVTLEDSVGLIDQWSKAALEVNPDVIVLCHGGPIAMPDDAQHVLTNAEARARLLRCQLDGATAGRGSAGRADAPLQAVDAAHLVTGPLDHP